MHAWAWLGTSAVEAGEGKGLQLRELGHLRMHLPNTASEKSHGQSGGGGTVKRKGGGTVGNSARVYLSGSWQREAVHRVHFHLRAPHSEARQRSAVVARRQR